MALCRVLGFIFFFYSRKQTIKRRECKDLQLTVNPALTGRSCLLHQRETSGRCRRGATSTDGTSLGPNRARSGWLAGGEGPAPHGRDGDVCMANKGKTEVSMTEGGSCTEHVVGWSPALQRYVEILLPYLHLHTAFWAKDQNRQHPH